MKYKEVAKQMLEDEFGTVVDRLGQEVDRRLASPCEQMRFHKLMMELLPHRAVLRRMWHAVMHRRWKARCEAGGSDVAAR